MSYRFVALALGLLLTTSAIASDGLPLSNICHTARAAMPVDSLVEQLATSPENASLLADAGDGRLDEVRRKLSAMSADEAIRWRQSAMMFAVQSGQSDVVAALLDDGADANATALLPGYKKEFFSRTLNPSMRRTFVENGMLNDHDTLFGPALPIAASCGDVATVDALLRHHADVMARQAPNIADALDTATMEGNAAIVQRLLDHGANACMHDRLGRERMLKADRKFIPLAEVGRRAGLPADLTARLICPAMASAH
jgi:ankyrin repeat protein